MSKGYIPQRDVDLVNWSLNFTTVLSASFADYHQLSGTATTLAGLQGTFSADFTLYGTVDRKAVNPATRTKAGVASLRAAKAAMLAAIRPVAVMISQDKTITDELKTTIGVTIRDSIHTPKPAPVTYPNLALVSAGPLMTEVRYADVNTPTKKSKPAGVSALQLFAVASPTVIADPSMIPFDRIITKQPFVITWDESNRGKTVYFTSRWQTPTGDVGSFGPITSVVIA